MLKWIDMERIREIINIETHRYTYWVEYGMSVPDLYLHFMNRKNWNQIFDGTLDSTGTPLTS